MNEQEEKYVLIYATGNGYNCGCCRQSYVNYETFDSVEDLVRCLKSEVGKDFQVKAIFKTSNVFEYADGSFDHSSENNAAVVAAELK